MTKETLKKYINDLHLDQELEVVLFDIIDDAPEINQILLNTIADILDLQADLYEKTADVLEQEAEEYDSLSADLDEIDKTEHKEKLELIKQNQEQLLESLKKQLAEAVASNAKSVEEVQHIETARQTIQAATKPISTAPASTI